MKRIQNSQKVRFAAVGVANTVIDFGLLFIFKYLGLPVLVANIGSTTSAFLFSFFANKKYAFRSSGSSKREFVLFTIVTLFGLWVIQSAVIALVLWLIDGLGLSSDLELFVAKLLATLASLIWNYVLYSRLVFVNQPK